MTGTIVTVNMTLFDPNGSVNSTQINTANVSKGEYLIWWFLLCANLTSGNNLWAGSAGYKVNETTWTMSAGANRTANHWYLTFASDSIHIYWDKPTGIMVRFKLHIGSAWFNMTLTSTSMWSAVAGGLFGLNTTTLLLLGGAGTIVVIGAVLVLRGRGKHGKKR